MSASVLCPGFVNTNLSSSARNRPEDLLDREAQPTIGVGGLLEQGKQPEEIAERVFDAVANDRFYILPHPAWDELVRERVNKILERGDPQRLDFAAMLAGRAAGEL